MLFNSYPFLFLFLPVVFAGYFAFLHFQKVRVATFWLVLASLFFYAFWNPAYLPLLLVSLGFNYFIGSYLARSESRYRKGVLALGILGNVFLLAYFKYTDFFLGSLNNIFDAGFSLPGILLPLAISFFTFQQIAYLVDSYRGLTKEYSFLNYSLFVTFFPQLIAGPIVHHREMMPQFESAQERNINYRNIATGLFILSVGLCKKVLIADTLAVWANAGFGSDVPLSFFEAWSTALAYTFQLYFDFSGYTDMAIGAALLFNIRLPLNFNGPYRAKNIQEFWRRWHITLTNFLRDYVYIPLGGNRAGIVRRYFNVFAVFLIGGLWHGAAWTFVAWGALHGTAMAIYGMWSKLGVSLPTIVSWGTTFVFVVFSWVMFRAESFADAFSLWKGMLGFNGISIPGMAESFLLSLSPPLQFNGFLPTVWPVYGMPLSIVLLVYIGLFALIFTLPNTHTIATRFRPTVLYFASTVVGFLVCIYFMGRVSEFIYFNF